MEFHQLELKKLKNANHSAQIEQFAHTAMAAEELVGTHTTRTPDMKVTFTAKTTVEVHTGHTTTQNQAEAAPAATAAGAAAGHKP